jgi:hypothetical protein
MGNQSRSNDAEIEIDDEDVHIGGKFRSRYGTGSRAKDWAYDNDPYGDDDALDDERRNGPFKKGKFCDSPELEMPAVNQRPEDE